MPEAITNASPLTAADVDLFTRNVDHCSLYLTDGMNDAGRWLPYLTGQPTLFDGPARLLPDYEQRLSLITLAQQPNHFDQLLAAQADYGFDCIFYGHRQLLNTPKRFDLDKLLSHPKLQVLDSQSGSYLFTLSPH